MPSTQEPLRVLDGCSRLDQVAEDMVYAPSVHRDAAGELRDRGSVLCACLRRSAALVEEAFVQLEAPHGSRVCAVENRGGGWGEGTGKEGSQNANRRRLASVT